jgi:DNA-binding transcriptional regulator YdaS (Cro superfamily)
MHLKYYVSLITPHFYCCIIQLSVDTVDHDPYIVNLQLEINNKGEYMIDKKDVATVSDAIDRVIAATHTSNTSGLADRIGVSKQAISKWRSTGLIPTYRALQMCWASEGAVTWMQLCPHVIREFNQEI